jgi:Ca2+-binding RTX toxin-like protein
MANIFGTSDSDTIIPGFSSAGVTGGVIAPVFTSEDDIIDGGAGADIMDGGDGSDIYFVDNIGDLVAEQFNDPLGGVDEIRSSVSYSIGDFGSNGFGIENITLLGSSNINATGNSNNNVLVGNGARNIFFGSAGSDSYDGLGGFDTIDYGALGTAVTLKSQGIIEKGPFGTDTIAGMERIIGAAGQINLIDGFTGGPQPTSFEIDLDGSLLLVKNIPFIGDQAFFIKNFVNVRGTSNDDFITGSSLPGIQGDNTFFGSSGNDSYDGAGGIDTIDYSSLGQRVTLKSQGVIEKDGAFGTDTIAGVERIIGTFGFVNVIDGTVAGPQTTSFDINLATNNLTVNGIPGIGSTSFFIQNFTDVRGTSNSDTVVGDDSFSFFFGSAGNDSYDGGGGLDRIDYSGLGQSITLKSQGVIEKAGGLGTDTIAGIEQIIGDVGQSNLIDGTVAGPQVTSFDINLATNNLTVNGIPGIGSASFFVQNFTDVRGTTNSDIITGNTAENILNGGSGDDVLKGSFGDDVLDGGSGNDVLDGGGFDAFDGPVFSFNNNLYILSEVDSWTNAQAQAQALGGNLVAINDAAENQFLLDSFGGSETFWFGFTDAASEGTFTWVNGDPVTYTNWDIGEPNNLGDEDYGTFRPNGFWNDLSENFDSLRGIIELNDNDIILGSSGNDLINGGFGSDTVDYSTLGQRVTLKSQGVIEKAGGFGTDTIAGVERIIGSLGQSNVIDGTVAGPQATSFNINLATNNLTVNGIPGIGSASFFIENFTDVRGTINSDTVVGDALANSFTGGGGNDTLNTGAGNDTLSGGAGNDILIGGTGADRFRFDAPLNAATNRDIVSDFSIAQGDRFELENSVFTALTTTGTLAANAFFIGAAATTATQRILYNSAAGSLLYDRDGIGGFGSIAFATITSGLALTNTSFTIT